MRPGTDLLSQANPKVITAISPDVQISWDRPSAAHNPHTFEHLEGVRSMLKATSAIDFSLFPDEFLVGFIQTVAKTLLSE